jgi:hypothetical protein
MVVIFTVTYCNVKSDILRNYEHSLYSTSYEILTSKYNYVELVMTPAVCLVDHKRLDRSLLHSYIKGDSTTFTNISVR